MALAEGVRYILCMSSSSTCEIKLETCVFKVATCEVKEAFCEVKLAISVPILEVRVVKLATSNLVA